MKNIRFLFYFIAISFNLSPATDITDGKKWGPLHAHGHAVNLAVQVALDSATRIVTMCSHGDVALANKELEACEASAVQARVHAGRAAEIANSFKIAQDFPNDAQVAFELGRTQKAYGLFVQSCVVMLLHDYAKRSSAQQAAVARAQASAAAGAYCAEAEQAVAVLAAARDVVAKKGTCCR